MKTADWKQLTKSVLGDDWRFSKTLAYRAPVGWVVHGLLAEDSSAHHPDFYLWMVRMPLVVPTDIVDLSWSERFGDSSRVFDPSALATKDALTQAARIVSEDSASESVLVDPPGGSDNVRMQEARAYGMLLMGNPPGAIEVLGRVLRYEPRYPWEKELLSRAEEIRSLLNDGQVDRALHQLKAWRLDSLRALGIDAE